MVILKIPFPYKYEFIEFRRIFFQKLQCKGETYGDLDPPRRTK